MTHKTAYLWGPISSFTGPLAALLLHKGWQVHIATKSSLNLFTLAPLDLRSAAQSWLERALGGHDQLQIFQERFRFLDQGELGRGTTYDAVIFCGLPPNFDESRVPRAPWAAGELAAITKLLKGVPTFIVSSLWGGVQPDGVVPEEFEFERRKPQTHWEGVCQQYENRLLQSIVELEAPWHLIRLPLITGSTVDGSILNFSGLSSLLRELSSRSDADGKTLKLGYNPDSTLWFSPVNTLVSLFWRLLEDEARPRICNLVSTQSILNREWVQYLAQALHYEQVEDSKADPWNFSGVIRKVLRDALNVKTRNLFEVAGRYHHTPILLDVSYFEKLISFGKSENWGKLVAAGEKQLPYSRDLAHNYFEEFIPAHLTSEIIGEVTKNGARVGFFIDSASEPLSYVLRADNGHALVEPLEPSAEKPRVCFHFSGDTMTKLASSKLTLQRGLLTGQVLMKGPLLDGLRVSSCLSRFLHNNPYKPEDASNHNS